jgi:hypothetical protein
MDFKKNAEKPIPCLSEGTFVGEIARITNNIFPYIQDGRIKRFQEGTIKSYDPERSLMFSQWGIHFLVIILFFF